MIKECLFLLANIMFCQILSIKLIVLILVADSLVLLAKLLGVLR